MNDTPAHGGDAGSAAPTRRAERDHVDRSKIDFDPDDGLYSDTAVTGTSGIPGPHVDEDGEVDLAGEAGHGRPGHEGEPEADRERDAADEPDG